MVQCACAYANEDFNCACVYSVINNVLKVVLSSTHAVGKVAMHLSWLSNRLAGVFLLLIKVPLAFFHKVV